jgi:peptidyl-prolyl cis-trans isomerase A (cyclophilin A)
MLSLTFTTPVGNFSIRLHTRRAPATSAYFRRLADDAMFADASVFRITAEVNRDPNDPCPIDIVQVGPAQTVFASRHPIEHESTRQTGLTHTRWTASAARFDLGELYGSFFICMRDEHELDYGGQRQSDGQGFAAFGRVVSGFDTLENIYARAESSEMLSSAIPIELLAAPRCHTGNTQR